ncbi:MAG: tripartite tricarboxylate transporter permease [Methanosarcinaceae archaeon]|nr:tripartite tricarboxylate transporter permease [Methanosarcinaceae archaeon]
MILLSVLAGYLLGVFSGLVPGIHTNNFALLLVAFSPMMSDYGIQPFYIAVIILSNSIAHTFHDIIPAIFLGAPDSDMALAVLPGHRLLLDGFGAEAIRLSALGSAGSVVFSMIIVLPLAAIFSIVYPVLQDHIAWVLIFIVFLMIATEKGDYIIGQGSLAHYKYKGYAIVLFLISGALGLFAFEMEGLMDPVINFGAPSILLPLLSGLFGASQLVISLLTHSTIPPQTFAKMTLSGKRIVRGIITGSAAGSIVAWLPGISSAIAAVLARLFVRKDFDSEGGGEGKVDADGVDAGSKEFIVSVSGVNTSNAIFGLVALSVIGKTRSGAMVAINDVLGTANGVIGGVITLDTSTLLLFFGVILLTAFLSYFSTIMIGNNIHRVISRIDYSKLCVGVIIGLALMVVAFTGFFGLLIFIIATPIGMLAPFFKVRKSNAMGVILLPVILYFI